MRKEFEMTEEDLNALLKACKPVPYMVIGGYVPRSPQENANDAWERLGKKMGFDHMTVRPISGKGDRFFTAESK
jgi:predicted TIM-barrel fold metal-dependent hydrolase